MEATKEKRQPRSYKITKSVYEKAKKKALKENSTLANVIENFVINYVKKTA